MIPLYEKGLDPAPWLSRDQDEDLTRLLALDEDTDSLTPIEHYLNELVLERLSASLGFSGMLITIWTVRPDAQFPGEVLRVLIASFEEISSTISFRIASRSFSDSYRNDSSGS